MPGLGILWSILGFFGGMSPETKRVLAIGLAILAAIIAVDRRATWKAEAKCEKAKVESRERARQADQNIGEQAGELADRESGTLDEQSRKKDAEISDLKQKVAKLTADKQCLFGPRAGDHPAR